MKLNIHKTKSYLVCALELIAVLVFGFIFWELVRYFMWTCYDAGMIM